MADPSPWATSDRGPRDDDGCIKHAVLFSCSHTSNDDPGDSANFNTAGELPLGTGVVMSFKLLLESMMRIKLIEVEMAKAMEALRPEAEWRRAELDDEMTWMLLLISSCGSI